MAQHVRNGRLGKQARQKRARERVTAQRMVEEKRWEEKLLLLEHKQKLTDQ